LIKFLINLFFLVCCTTTVRASTVSLIWNFITLIVLAVLIAFDIVFITNPYTCLLTPSCSSQSQLTSTNFLTQTGSQFQYYSIYDSKKLFLEIQVGCAGLAFILTIVYIIIFLVCRLKLRKRALEDNPAAGVVAPRRGLRIAQASVVPYANLTNAAPYIIQ
jgi:Na+/melibiose symporter-like transporter